MKNILLLLLILAPLAHLFAQGQRLPMYPSGKLPYETLADEKNLPWLEYYPAYEKTRNGAAVLIIPGGSYGFVSLDNEGYPVANWLSQNGFAAYILRYRLPDSARQSQPYWVPLTDALTAIRFIRLNGQSMGVNPAKVGVIGFSAGGHLAGSLCTIVDKHPEGDPEDRPAFSVLVYPVITMAGAKRHQNSRQNLLGRNPPAYRDSLFSLELQVSPQTPPTYLVHSQDDDVVAVENTLDYHAALRRKGVATVLNVYPTGKHGYGLGAANGKAAAETKAPEWAAPCMVWLKEQAK
jgi:acetyl esterase/lipase